MEEDSVAGFKLAVEVLVTLQQVFLLFLVFKKTLKSKTISSNFKDMSVHQCPPNGPGVTVLLMLKLLEKLKINKFRVQ